MHVRTKTMSAATKDLTTEALAELLRKRNAHLAECDQWRAGRNTERR